MKDELNVTKQRIWEDDPPLPMLAAAQSWAEEAGLAPQGELGRCTFSASWPAVRLQILGTVLYGVRTLRALFTSLSVDGTGWPPPSV